MNKIPTSFKFYPETHEELRRLARKLRKKKTTIVEELIRELAERKNVSVAPPPEDTPIQIGKRS